MTFLIVDGALVPSNSTTSSRFDESDATDQQVVFSVESPAKEQVIDELVDSIVRRYKHALDELGRE